MSTMLRKRGLLGAAATAIIVYFGGMQSASALEKVRLLIPVRNIDEAFSPFVVAKEKGYFASEGYDVTLIAVGGSNESAIQVSAGNAEVGAASPGEALVGVQSGKLDIRYFYGLYYSNIWSVAVLPDSPIKALGDLKGKKLGVQSMGSAGTTFGRAFVQAAGLDPDKDVSFLPIGVGAQAVTSIRQKFVDGAVYWDAALAKFKFSGLGLRELPVAENLRALPDVGLLARTQTIESNPKMLTGIGRAVAKGYDYSMANPKAAVLITWKTYPEAASKNPDSAAALEEGITVNQARLGIWSTPKIGDKHGTFVSDDWNRLINFFVDQKALPAPIAVDHVLTNQFIDSINNYDRTAIINDAKKDGSSKPQGD
ncbi:ABC transporter substrate-binding protein [Bradyrhizobium elkanii]|uniref:ABC transporter substrate-binding protein n=1 Tax=Bradyrhizobium elkanii TaxID=29448 RepID=UPI0004ACEE4C|nr:ABC transporter substrate-binding protein [Bradyrhizobium elkanii]WLA81015.1 ABC transporter substrate-binding protein [Bradyrhizobium elkanii]